MPNFSSVVGLEGTEKFVGGWCGLDGLQVAAMSNLNPGYFELL